VVLLLTSACSSGGGDPAGGANNPPLNDNNGPPVTRPTVTPTGGGGVAAPSADSKAGVWVGSFGLSSGVYVVDNNNNLYGLAIEPDGAANSVFGNLGAGNSFSGVLDTHFHPPTNAVSGANFAPQGEDPATNSAFNLNIINGQTIEDAASGVALTFSAPGTLTPATFDSVAGQWRGVHSFCSPSSCSEFVIDLTFSGGNFTGQTGVVRLDSGTDVFPVDMAGALTQFGDVLLANYNWGSRSLQGVVYFNGDGRLVINGDNAAEMTISAVMNRR